jgi:hypothetical protein
MIHHGLHRMGLVEMIDGRKQMVMVGVVSQFDVLALIKENLHLIGVLRAAPIGTLFPLVGPGIPLDTMPSTASLRQVGVSANCPC